MPTTELTPSLSIPLSNPTQTNEVCDIIIESRSFYLSNGISARSKNNTEKNQCDYFWYISIIQPNGWDKHGNAIKIHQRLLSVVCKSYFQLVVSAVNKNGSRHNNRWYRISRISYHLHRCALCASQWFPFDWISFVMFKMITTMATTRKKCTINVFHKWHPFLFMIICFVISNEHETNHSFSLATFSTLQFVMYLHLTSQC